MPYSHVTQVCTHSYTLVWYDWEAWEQFIDWMALAGHNSIVAPTGQEEVQYKVLTSAEFGLTDMQVRNCASTRTLCIAWYAPLSFGNSHSRELRL